jgi:hypothetical protein
VSDPAEHPGPGAAIARLEAKTRKESMAIRMRASAEAEEAAAAALAEADGAIDRRIARLRELRTELAEASARIERDLRRAAGEIGRRAEFTYPPNP